MTRRPAPRTRSALAALRLRLRRDEPSEPIDRGDVPGWVLVTIMTAGLVAALWAVAGPMLTKLFQDAVQGAVGG